MMGPEALAVRKFPPVRWNNPTTADLSRWVKTTTENGGRITLSSHALRDRLAQRGFTMGDVSRMVRDGYAYRRDPGTNPGEWKVNLAVRMPNGRDAAAVCLAAPHADEVRVLTVLWIDRSWVDQSMC